MSSVFDDDRNELNLNLSTKRHRLFVDNDGFLAISPIGTSSTRISSHSTTQGVENNSDFDVLESERRDALTSDQRVSELPEIIEGNAIVRSEEITESCKRRWERLCRTEFLYLTTAFNFPVVRCFLPDLMMGLLVHMYQNEEVRLYGTEIIDAVFLGIASIRFSKPVGCGKKVWQTTIGKVHVEFRTIIVNRVIHSVSLNPEAALLRIFQYQTG